MSTEGRRLLTDVSQSVCGCVVDIDECLLKEDDCSQTCVNVPGGFTCACLPGFLLDNDAKKCNSEHMYRQSEKNE